MNVMNPGNAVRISIEVEKTTPELMNLLPLGDVVILNTNVVTCKLAKPSL